ncbi:MAG: DMT family transporter [Pseudomonadota bacterium]
MPLPHLLLALIACVAWGFNFIASAAALQHWPPFLFTIVRFAFVAILVAAVLKRPPREQWPRLIAVCLLNGAIHFSLFFFALRAAPDITSMAILMQCYVPLSALLAWALLGETFGVRTGLSIGVAFLGVLLVGLEPQVFARLEAVALALAGTLALAFGTILMRDLKGVDPFSFQGWTALLSLPVLLGLSLWLEADQLELLRTAGWQPWVGAIYSAIAASIVGHGIFFYLIRRHPVARVTTYLLLTPILAATFGVIFWGDRPGWRLLVGGALVLGGVLVITLRAGKRAEHAS